MSQLIMKFKLYCKKKIAKKNAHEKEYFKIMKSGIIAIKTTINLSLANIMSLFITKFPVELLLGGTNIH